MEFGSMFTRKGSSEKQGCYKLQGQRDNQRKQDEGRVLGPLWPTRLALAPVALEAKAARNIPAGYYRNNGTWGSPYAAKVGPTSRPTKKTNKTWTRARTWVTHLLPK